MAQLIDTSVWIDAERRKLDPVEFISGLPGQTAALAAITATELLVGVLRADNALRRFERQAFVEMVFRALPIVEFDLVVAREYARLTVELRGLGHMVGAHDLQIAATALARGYEVTTLDGRDFGRILALVVNVRSDLPTP